MTNQKRFFGSMKRTLSFLLPFLVLGCVATVHAPPTSSVTFMGPSATSLGNYQHEKLTSPPSPLVRSVDEQKKLLEQTFKKLQVENAELCKRVMDDINLRNCDWISLKGHNFPTVISFPWNDLYINVTSKLISYVENEDEMAYVLAHELGHQLARHVAENLPNTTVSFNYKSDLPMLALCGVCVIGTASGANYAETIQQHNALFGEVTDNHFTATQEREADYIAAYMIVRAGYDLNKAVNFLKKMEKLNPRTGEKLKNKAAYFDIHAFSPIRFRYLDAFEKEIAEKQRKGPPLFPNADS